MKSSSKLLIIALCVVTFALPLSIMAGNKDRAGQAGASELLINPWAKSAGWNGANVACAIGLESMFTNIAGMAFTPKTELVFSHTNWLKGSEVFINNFGFSQKVGESGVLGASVMAMNFGDIPITTDDLPEGGIGTYAPKYMNINFAFAKAFSNSIYGGFNIKLISEATSDISAQGFGIDAGIQYVTGIRDNIHFGIALKNWGPTMKFKGDGLSIRSWLSTSNSNQYTLEQRSAEFDLPLQLNIGGSYAFLFNEKHHLTLAGAFVSNAFYKDQFILGGEYFLMDYVGLRAAYAYENGINSAEDRTNALTGFSGGLTVQVPLSKEKNTKFAIDYSYRSSDPFAGTHSIAVRMNF